MEEIKPNFLIIGVPKAGTTSLYNYLKSHPEIYMPATTELRYFNNQEMLKSLNGPDDKQAIDKICKDWDQYQSYFKEYHNEKAIGECTTSYLYSNTALDRIKSELADDTKLIVILREPVSRAFSNYQYYVRRGKEKVSFEEALNDEDRRINENWNNAWFHKSHSFYSNNIKKLINCGLSYKILFFEDLISKPKNILKELFEYLEVDASYFPESQFNQYNKGGVFRYKSISNWLTKPSKTRVFVKTIVPKFVLSGYRKKREQFLSSNTRSLQLAPETKAKLKEYFKEDVFKLNELIEFDKSKWGY